jgi:sec-independent protein translocase protein TatB
MFDIGWSELLLIGIVALIAIGPKELPGALRTLGQWMAKVRRMASEFQNQFHEAMREAELADLKKEVDEMTTKAQSYAHFDPVAELGKDIESAVSAPSELSSPVTTTPPPSATSESPAPTPAPTPSTADATGLQPPPASEPAAPTQAAEPAPAPKEGAASGEATHDAGRAA